MNDNGDDDKNDDGDVESEDDDDDNDDDDRGDSGDDEGKFVHGVTANGNISNIKHLICETP